MKNLILVGFLSLWIFSIVTPSVMAIVDKGESSLLLLCHNEEEQKEADKKDKLEEKIIPEANRKELFPDQQNKSDLFGRHLLSNTGHIEEIPLPPPEHYI